MDKNEKIKILQDLIHLDTENGNELIVTTYLKKILAKYHIPVKIQIVDHKRANLTAEIGNKEDDRVLAFEGHQDTVSVGSLDQWHHDPFKAEIVGDKLYGRGSADMKSGLAAEVIALIELSASKKFPKGTVRLLASFGEEYGAPGAYLFDKKKAVEDVSAMLVGEPTSGNIVYAHSGSLNYRIKSFGQTAHSSAPSKGINAITELSRYIAAEPSIFAEAPTDPLLGKAAHSITLIKGGSQVNTIPDYAELCGNVRPTKSFSNPQVISSIKNKIKELNVNGQGKLSFELIHNFYPIATKPDNAFVKLVTEAASQSYTDHKPQLKIIHGATDASVFIQSRPEMPVVVLGPDTWELAHQVNEYTTISSYLATIETYKKVALTYFN